MRNGPVNDAALLDLQAWDPGGHNGIRDIGPTFVTDGRRLTAVDRVFNGWGAQPWVRWEHDAPCSTDWASRRAGGPYSVGDTPARSSP